MNNKKSTLNKLISFILSYSLLFNNIVYASSIVTLFNEDIENKLYYNNIEDIEGDLSLESTQDTNEYYANDKQLGFTAGVDQGSVALGSRTSEHSSKYTKQTSIDSEGTININAKGNLHLKGAAITNNDEDKLNINVNSITHEDMENEEHNIDTGINFDTGFGDKVFQGTTTIGLTDKENIKESVTRSTISKGNNINIKEGNIDKLNRDKERIEEVTRDEILSANDFSFTLDNRLLTKEGRDEIVRDIVDLPNNLKKIINDITITADMVTSYIKTLNENNKKSLDQQITVIWDETLIASNSPSAASLAIVTDPDIVKSTIELFTTMGIALMPGDTIIIPATLAVGGVYILYRGGKFVASVLKNRQEAKQQEKSGDNKNSNRNDDSGNNDGKNDNNEDPNGKKPEPSPDPNYEAREYLKKKVEKKVKEEVKRRLDEKSDATENGKSQTASPEDFTKLNKKFDKHKEGFGDISKEEYLQRARSLRDSKGKNIEEFVRPNGDVMKYNKDTNELVITDKNGNVRTFFKPTEGINYWLNDAKK